MARLASTADTLYGKIDHARIEEYVQETARLRWSHQEMMILWVWASTKTIQEMSEMLPGRSDQQIRRMLEHLTS